MTKYNVDYFIDKFEKIPEDKWCVGEYVDSLGRMCALGHCGERTYGNPMSRQPEIQSFRDLLFAYGFLADKVNDGDVPIDFAHKDRATPKSRILAVLRLIKTWQSKSWQSKSWQSQS